MGDTVSEQLIREVTRYPNIRDEILSKLSYKDLSALKPDEKVWIVKVMNEFPGKAYKYKGPSWKNYYYNLAYGAPIIKAYTFKDNKPLTTIKFTEHYTVTCTLDHFEIMDITSMTFTVNNSQLERALSVFEYKKHLYIRVITGIFDIALVTRDTVLIAYAIDILTFNDKLIIVYDDDIIELKRGHFTSPHLELLDADDIEISKVWIFRKTLLMQASIDGDLEKVYVIDNNFNVIKTLHFDHTFDGIFDDRYLYRIDIDRVILQSMDDSGEIVLNIYEKIHKVISWHNLLIIHVSGTSSNINLYLVIDKQVILINSLVMSSDNLDIQVVGDLLYIVNYDSHSVNIHRLSKDMLEV